jgi:hypothetical protein
VLAETDVGTVSLSAPKQKAKKAAKTLLMMVSRASWRSVAGLQAPASVAGDDMRGVYMILIDSIQI